MMVFAERRAERVAPLDQELIGCQRQLVDAGAIEIGDADRINVGRDAVLRAREARRNFLLARALRVQRLGRGHGLTVFGGEYYRAGLSGLAGRIERPPAEANPRYHRGRERTPRDA